MEKQALAVAQFYPARIELVIFHVLRSESFPPGASKATPSSA
jgi:hypothetical protein